MAISLARLVLARVRPTPDAPSVAASAPCDPGFDGVADGAGICLLVVVAALVSPPASAGAVAAAGSSICSAATDPARARELRRRDWRSPLRAGLFAPPLSTLAAVFACLLVCCLAIAVFLWIGIAPVAMLALPQARRSGRAGRQPRRGRQRGQQCLPCAGSRAELSTRRIFFPLAGARLGVRALCGNRRLSETNNVCQINPSHYILSLDYSEFRS